MPQDQPNSSLLIIICTLNDSGTHVIFDNLPCPKEFIKRELLDENWPLVMLNETTTIPINPEEPGISFNFEGPCILFVKDDHPVTEFMKSTITRIIDGFSAINIVYHKHGSNRSDQEKFFQKFAGKMQYMPIEQHHTNGQVHDALKGITRTYENNNYNDAINAILKSFIEDRP